MGPGGPRFRGGGGGGGGPFSHDTGTLRDPLAYGTRGHVITYPVDNSIFLFPCRAISHDISHLLYFHNRAKWAIIVIICLFRGTREI